jgi:CheY-like chemotaxis protein
VNTNILWVDDEVAMLRAHIMFLENKGYAITTATNGHDALDLVRERNFDLVFLDENMPGISGIETLKHIKEIRPTLSVVMITKSEEEDIMNRAIGSQIADYLIKPVNPNQVLLCIKRLLHHRQIVSEQSTADYRLEFNQIAQLFSSAKKFEDWVEIYRKLVGWDIALQNEGVREVLSYQLNEANNEFSKFITNSYLRWFDKNGAPERPLMSQNLLRSKVFPHVKPGSKIAFLLIDNLRYDHWRVMAPTIQQLFKIEQEDLYCAILPTSTQYARNAIFSGLMPSEIEKVQPEFWLNDEDEGGKNQFEEELLRRNMQRQSVSGSLFFTKIVSAEAGKQVLNEKNKLDACDFAAIVYNFIDAISHASTETKIMRELVGHEQAYRSITQSWFQHSDLLELLKELAARKYKVIISSDHGTIRVQNPVKVVGDKNTSVNLRYKTGKALTYNPREVFEIRRPEDACLPRTNLSSGYVFARNRDFLVYPNNCNQHVKYYRNTFQHGGISMEEMIVPVVTLLPM